MSHDFTTNTGRKTTGDANVNWRTCPKCQLNLEPSIAICPRDGTVLEDRAATELGVAELLFDGQYKILEVIASGGMGTVYKAVKRSLSKTVAIKMLKTQDTSTTMFARFRQEAYTASLLNHPNIIGVDDFGVTSENMPFMVMDYIDGSDLSALLKTEGKLNPSEAVRIFIQICDGMEHAHSKGVLHRDLKPSNIMLTNLSGKPEVKIVDFGIAKFTNGVESQHLTQTGEIFGSPYYMSPEQTVAKAVDHRSDIYSVGCIMYEALSGVVPISGNTAFETLMKHMSEKPQPIQDRALKENISDGLQKIVMKALEKEPGKRQQTMSELKAQLESVPEARGKSPSMLSLNGTSYGITSHTKKLVLLGALVACGAVWYGVNQLGMHEKHAENVEATETERLKRLTKAEPDYVASNESGMVEANLKKHSGGEADDSPATNVAAAGDTKRPRPTLQAQVKWEFLGNRELARHINDNPEISNLCLSDCVIDNDGAKQIAKLNLQRLELLQCSNIRAAGYRAIIDSQPYLQLLKITHARSNADDDSPKKGENIIAYLSKLPELRSLALNDFSSLTGDDLAHLPKTIEDLSLAKNKRIPTNKIADLAAYTKLVRLDLAGTLVSDATIAKLTKLTKLKDLELGGCPIGDDAVSSILKFKNLEKLGLEKTSIGPEGFFKLTALDKLNDLNVKDDSAITYDDAMKFETMLNLRVCIIEPHVKNSEAVTNGSLTDDLNKPTKK